MNNRHWSEIRDDLYPYFIVMMIIYYNSHVCICHEQNNWIVEIRIYIELLCIIYFECSGLSLNARVFS